MLKSLKIKPNDRPWLEHRIGKRSTVIGEQRVRVKSIFRMAPEVVTRKQYGPKVDICAYFTFVSRTMTISSFLFREFGYYGHWNDRRYYTILLLGRFYVSCPLGEPPYLNESPLRVSESPVWWKTYYIIVLYLLGSVFDCHEWQTGDCCSREVIAPLRRFPRSMSGSRRWQTCQCISIASSSFRLRSPMFSKSLSSSIHFWKWPNLCWALFHWSMQHEKVSNATLDRMSSIIGLFLFILWYQSTLSLINNLGFAFSLLILTDGASRDLSLSVLISLMDE